MMKLDIQASNVKTLKAKAKERGISGAYKMTRPQLVEALTAIQKAEAKVTNKKAKPDSKGSATKEMLQKAARAKLAKRAAKAVSDDPDADDDLLGDDDSETEEDSEEVTTAAKLPNLLKRRFGKSVTKKALREWVNEVWEGTFKLGNIQFKDEHYWLGTVKHVESKEQYVSVRLDYLINYARPPKGTMKFDDVAAQRAKIEKANS